MDGITGLDNVDQCVVHYNQAVVLYHKRQHNAAIVLLDKLFQFVEPMGEPRPSFDNPLPTGIVGVHSFFYFYVLLVEIF